MTSYTAFSSEYNAGCLAPSPQSAGEPVPQCARGEKGGREACRPGFRGSPKVCARISGVGTPPQAELSNWPGLGARVGKTECETGI